MTTLVVASAKGSPGVTTVSLAVASWWARRVIVVEADLAGGDVAAYLDLTEEPGLVNLAAHLRRAEEPESSGGALDAYAQPVRPGWSVIPAPASAVRARAACRALPAIAALSDGEHTGLLVDVGRVSDPHRLAGDHDEAVPICWVVRPSLGAVAHLVDAVGSAPEPSPSCLVVVGPSPYADDEVSAVTGLPVLGHLPHDPSGVEALLEGNDRRWARSPLGRAARDLAARLEDWLEPPPSLDGRPPGDTEDVVGAGPDVVAPVPAVAVP